VTEHLTDYTRGLYACDDRLARYGRPETVVTPPAVRAIWTARRHEAAERADDLRPQ
jgi:hypothetical protein